MSRVSSWFAVVAVLSVSAVGCGDDGSSQGFRGPCAAPGAIDCPSAPLETAEDLCWRLVECGSIPVAGPEGNSVFDWPRCVESVNSLDDYQFEFSLACVEASTCDELKTNGSPNDPGVPVCLRHGNQ